MHLWHRQFHAAEYRQKSRSLHAISYSQPSPGRSNGRTSYALEGSVFIAGAVVQWLRDELQIIRKAAEIEELAASVPDTAGVYFVPAFSGLGAPHWDPYARGTIGGLTRGTNRAHIARAALEGIAFQVADIIDAMETDSGVPLKELRVDGGAARNNLLMQIQADLLGFPSRGRRTPKQPCSALLSRGARGRLLARSRCDQEAMEERASVRAENFRSGAFHSFESVAASARTSEGVALGLTGCPNDFDSSVEFHRFGAEKKWACPSLTLRVLAPGSVG